MHWLNVDVRSLQGAYARAEVTASAVVEEWLGLADRPGYETVWISRFSAQALRGRAADLERAAVEHGLARLPLYGVLVAVKDNIDVAGLPTTAACPAYAYAPERSATAVRLLEAAGAIILGKTNLDQFATGLVGVRSPYGEVPNAFNPLYVAGGSSSGSAVALALGQAHLALGSDTAGSGRVPAALNNLVGLKPSRGLVSTDGLVPACRSLDCVSVLARTVDDALLALSVLAPDAAFRPSGGGLAGESGRPPRLAVPGPRHLACVDEGLAKDAFAGALETLRGLGAELVEVDFTPFEEAAELLYDGPFVAERLEAAGELLRLRPSELDPVVAAIIARGLDYSALDAFLALRKVAALRARALGMLAGFDALVVPSIPRFYRREELKADPIGPNRHLGSFTNGVNLLDLCALAVPTGFRADGLPAGITLIAPPLHDANLARLGRGIQAALKLPLGATAEPYPAFAEGAEPPHPAPRGAKVAVVGAHRLGMPLNGQLTGLGARLLETVRTAPEYRLHRLPDSVPPKPALARSPGDGAAIELEIWELPLENFGEFVAMVPPPLGIGTLTLEDGRQVQGFICEGYAVRGAEDITRHGSWIRYLDSLKGPERA